MLFYMKLFKNLIIAATLLPLMAHAQQQTINLYQGAVPNSKPTKLVDQTTLEQGMFRRVVNPQLEVYAPEAGKANGTAVIIIPGGSYKVVVYQSEGIRSAQEFAKNGVTAFVLKYRLPEDSTMVDKTIGPLQDAQQAIKIVREGAAKWNLDVNKIGVVGFSAGGHLASTIGTHYQKAVIENSNNTNLRPDFLVLIYPVISMQEGLTHADSRKNLLGATPSKATVDLYSNEMQINDKTPATFLVHAADDNVVKVENSIGFYDNLRKNKVPAEIHLFQQGGHGLRGHAIEDWMNPLIKWMQADKFITK